MNGSSHPITHHHHSRLIDVSNLDKYFSPQSYYQILCLPSCFYFLITRLVTGPLVTEYNPLHGYKMLVSLVLSFKEKIVSVFGF